MRRVGFELHKILGYGPPMVQSLIKHSDLRTTV